MSLTPQQRQRFEQFRALLEPENGLTLCQSKDGVKDGLAYFGSMIPGTSWGQTDEGYRIYRNVPICRTGSQQYLGREIKKNRGYKPEWDIKDDEIVTVYRPYNEVTDPNTIASFEGKSVLDEHPEGEKVLIDALDEFDGYSKGHGQNVRVGDMLESGETVLIADLHVKHPELNLKIEGAGLPPVRDISAGYTFILDRDETGRYYMKQIRGNHIAVVPKGRAGSEVGIRDAALSLTRSSKMTARFSAPKTPVRDFFAALGFKKWAETASDEAVADAMAEMGATKDAEESEEKKDKKDKDGAADKKGMKDDDDEHPKGCRCTDCMGAKDGKGTKDDDLEDVDEEGSMSDKKGAKDKKGGAKDDAEILTGDETTKTDFPLSVGGVKDSIANLRLMKPTVAASRDPQVRKAYNEEVRRVRQLRDGVKDGSIADPYASLTSPRDADAAIDAEPEQAMFMFFNGVSHQEGLKRWNEYQAARQTRK